MDKPRCNAGAKRFNVTLKLRALVKTRNVHCLKSEKIKKSLIFLENHKISNDIYSNPGDLYNILRFFNKKGTCKIKNGML